MTGLCHWCSYSSGFGVVLNSADQMAAYSNMSAAMANAAPYDPRPSHRRRQPPSKPIADPIGWLKERGALPLDLQT